MRKLVNTIELTAEGKGARGMGGTISLDDVEVFHANFQLTGAINEDVVQELARTVRDLARSRGLWAR